MRRIDIELVNRNIAHSRTQAQQYITQKRITCDTKLITKPATKIATHQNIQLLPNTNEKEYVSRSAHKLEQALKNFPTIKIHNSTCLDIGASTGGFTDVLLQHGAKKITAIDVGHGQIHPKIRSNPKVIVKEKTNIKNFTLNKTDTPPDIIVTDISFISLTNIIPNLTQLTKPQTQLLLLIKPQFEIGKQHLKNKGIVTNKTDQIQAIKNVINNAQKHNLQLQGLTKNTLTGKHGNQEYFSWLNHNTNTKINNTENYIKHIVTEK